MPRQLVHKLALAASVYFVWQERNSRIFSNEKRSSIVLIKEILDLNRLRADWECRMKNVDLWRRGTIVGGCVCFGLCALGVGFERDCFVFCFARLICLVSCVCFGCCLPDMALCLSLSVLLLVLAVCLCLSCLSRFPCLFKIVVF